MIGALKTLGTVLTIASTASFGKDLYDKHKDKKRARQINEVHNFISSLDLEALQDAIESKNEEALIDAVEDIIIAAETVKSKSELEELAEDAQELATNIIDKVSKVTSTVIDKVQDKINDYELEKDIDRPTYKEFKKLKKPLALYANDGTQYIITVDMVNVFTNNKTKSVTYIVDPNESIIEKLD